MTQLLNTKWKMLYDFKQFGKATPESWASLLKEVCPTIETVEQLSYVIHNTGDAEEWPTSSNIHFFREGINPAWEDERNINGGKWVLELSKDIKDDRVNDIWKRTVAFCASEQVENAIICGCVFSPRKNVDRIAVWMGVRDDSVKIAGRMWKQQVGFTDDVCFMVHENAMKGVRGRDYDLYKLQ